MLELSFFSEGLWEGHRANQSCFMVQGNTPNQWDLRFDGGNTQQVKVLKSVNF